MSLVKTSQTDEAINTNVDLDSYIKPLFETLQWLIIDETKKDMARKKQKYYDLLASVFICQGTSEGQLGVL